MSESKTEVDSWFANARAALTRLEATRADFLMKRNADMARNLDGDASDAEGYNAYCDMLSTQLRAFVDIACSGSDLFFDEVETALRHREVLLDSSSTTRGKA